MRRLALDVTRFRHMIEVEQMPQRQVAELLGIHRSSVERWCRRLGLTTQRTGPRSGDRHPDWRGGRVKVGRYWYRYCPDHPFCTKQRRVAEHRLVMEGKLRRFLHPAEVVHHVNGDPEDNRPENLAVFATNAAHLKHELSGRIPKWTPEGWARICAPRPQRRSRKG